ncbi:MAG: sugar transferase [Novosphingobium sp.]
MDFFADQESVRGDAADDGLRSARRIAEDLLILTDSRPTRQEPEAGSQGAQSASANLRKRTIEAISRLLDLAATLTFIVVLFPAMLLLTIAVAIDAKGLPIFAHRRIGKGGRPFDCYKFRTMCHDAEARLESILVENPEMQREWNEHHKLSNDPRITRFGHFLRETSLDELPQLFNVLFGDMALVGPRPIVQAELPRYHRYLSSYLSVKPGLTGLWQVTCRSESTYRRRVAIDRVYAARKCLLLDVRILFATVPAVLSRKGAC